MAATLFHKVTESFAGALFVGHSEGDLLFLEQVAVRTNTPPALVDALVQTLFAMKLLSGGTVAAPSHVVRFMGQVGIVTPYFEALPLRMILVAARAKRIPCPAGVALKVVLDVVDGLCEYHTLETALSGGVCPDQIMVGSDGDVRVGNIVVAAMPTKESPWRANVHRLAYLAPEQVSTATRYDSRTDVYAVAIILWELLSNQPRFIASASRILELLRAASGAAQLGQLNCSTLSPALVQVLKQALSPQPAERFSSMGSFARALLESGQEPASKSEVAKFVQQIADKPLHALRSAIRDQASFLTSRPPSVRPMASPLLRSDGPPRVPRPTSRKPSLPVESDHTMVYHVTAELLELAKRRALASDPPPALQAKAPGQLGSPVADEDQTVHFTATQDLLEESSRTVTFQVPPELLKEARRIFEGADDGANSSDPSSESASGDSFDPSGAHRDNSDPDEPMLSQPAGPTVAGAPTPEDDKTSIWRPDLRGIAASTKPVGPMHQKPQAYGSRRGGALLWSAIVCLVLALVIAAVKRLRMG